jgi:1-deoxy-D-xylulose-5-phosphate synthase
VTKKGKGYMPAENEPVRFHGTGPFDAATGAALIERKADSSKSYTEVFSKKLLDLARIDRKIIAITAAMPEGTGLDKFRDLYPERFFDVGIAESHAVCFAAGLAKAGLKPVVAVYSTFLQRAYDQIIEEVALQNLPVILAIDRAGIVGEDGATHQGIFDIGFLRSIPNLIIMAPKNGEELEMMFDFAVGLGKPVAIRYPRSKVNNLQHLGPASKLQPGQPEVLKRGDDFAIIALGSMVEPALAAMGLLNKEGLSGTLINARFVKPLDLGLLRDISAKMKFIFTIEEGILDGGFGSAVALAIDRPVERIGLPCEFIPHGRRDLLLDKYGLTADAIAKRIKSHIWQK